MPAIIFLFYGMVFFGSLVKLWGANHTLTLNNYKHVFTVGWEFIKDTLLLSSIATPIAGILAMIIAFLVVRKNFPGKRLMEMVSLLTFAVPGTVVGIGYILAFNQPPLVLTGTAAIIILLFIFRDLAVGVQTGIAELQQIDPSIEEASTDLGADSSLHLPEDHASLDYTGLLLRPGFHLREVYDRHQRRHLCRLREMEPDHHCHSGFG